MAPSVNVKVPVAEPTPVGEKETPTVQVLLGATPPVQLLLATAKPGLAVMLLKLSATD